MPRKTSDKKQLEILQYIYDTVEKRSIPPTVREICSAVGLSSTSTVHGHHLLRPALRRRTQLHLRVQLWPPKGCPSRGQPAHRTGHTHPVRVFSVFIHEAEWAGSIRSDCRGRDCGGRIRLRPVLLTLPVKTGSRLLPPCLLLTCKKSAGAALPLCSPDRQPHGSHSAPECGSSLYSRLPQALRHGHKRGAQHVRGTDRNGSALHPVPFRHHKLRGNCPYACGKCGSGFR